MVHMVFLESQEMMVPLEVQGLKDHLVIKVVMQLLKIALNAHHTVTSKVTKVLPADQEILVSRVDQAHLVGLVNAYPVHLEHLEVMVDQVLMESMADLVGLVSLEMLLALGRVPVQISSLA